MAACFSFLGKIATFKKQTKTLSSLQFSKLFNIIIQSQDAFREES